MLELIGVLWQQGLERPMVNGLIILANLFGGSFGLAILGFTVFVRGVTMPLTLKQLHSSRRLQTVQPRIQEIQKKYKDPRRRSEETLKLYREAGISPFGCLVPMIVQFPIWIALYRGLVVTVGGTPERLLDLAKLLYPWDFIQNAIPLASHFLWMDLGKPDMLLPGLVGISTWLQTKQTQTRSLDPRTASMNNMMLWMMPLMFAWFSLTVPSGLALYWLMTNVVGVIMNYFVFGWGGLRPTLTAPAPAAARPARARGGTPARVPAASAAQTKERRKGDGRSGGKRKDR